MVLSRQQRKSAREAHVCNSLGVSTWQDGTIFLNFHVDMTLRCNGGCRDCMKILGLAPLDHLESDLSEQDVDLVERLLKKYKLRLRRLRISGGEPLMHPRFVSMFKLIKSRWNPIVIRVYTNGLFPLPPEIDNSIATMRPLSMKEKKIRHVSFYASPADLGIEPVNGFANACRMSSGCGRSVNAFGFSPCMQYPHVGRMLGRDLQYGYPKLFGEKDVCQHCICSLPRVEQVKVRAMIANGKIEYPTKIYREGLQRLKEEPIEFASLASKVL